MAIPTSRTNEKAKVTIDYDKCKACGTCAQVCKDFTLRLEDGKITIDRDPIFGCMACGQCVAVCPNDSIKVEGRTLSSQDIVEIPEKESKTTFDQLYSLMFARRSVRDFKSGEIDRDIIDKIIASASTAPMGIPPSDIEILVLDGRDKVRQFTADCINYMKSMKWFFSPVTVGIMRPFIGKTTYQLFKSFVIPLVDKLIEEHEKGKDYLLYDAPLAMYFYGGPFSDPADQYIAATYAMIAAESLGLGSCMIGSIGPFIEKRAQKLKEKYRINQKNQTGLVVIFGYPKYKYRKAIKRTFAKVNYY